MIQRNAYPAQPIWHVNFSSCTSTVDGELALISLTTPRTTQANNNSEPSNSSWFPIAHYYYVIWKIIATFPKENDVLQNVIQIQPQTNLWLYWSNRNKIIAYPLYMHWNPNICKGLNVFVRWVRLVKLHLFLEQFHGVMDMYDPFQCFQLHVANLLRELRSISS